MYLCVCVCVCAGDKISTAHGVEVENMVDIIFEHTDGFVYNHVSNSVIFESSNDYVRTHLAPIFDTHYVSPVDNGVVISFHFRFHSWLILSKLVCSHLQLRHLMLSSQTEEPEVYPLSARHWKQKILFWTNQIVLLRLS